MSPEEHNDIGNLRQNCALMQKIPDNLHTINTRLWWRGCGLVHTGCVKLVRDALSVLGVSINKFAGDCQYHYISCKFKCRESSSALTFFTPGTCAAERQMFLAIDIYTDGDVVLG